MLRVTPEVRGNLVAGRMPVRVAGEREPGQRVVPARGEEDERVPAIPPRRPDGVRRLENHEALPLPGQGVADRKPRLSGADNSDVVAHVVHDNPFPFEVRDAQRPVTRTPGTDAMLLGTRPLFFSARSKNARMYVRSAANATIEFTVPTRGRMRACAAASRIPANSETRNTRSLNAKWAAPAKSAA